MIRKVIFSNRLDVLNCPQRTSLFLITSRGDENAYYSVAAACTHT